MKPLIDPYLASLFQTLIDITRSGAPRSHISSEFACTSSPDSGDATKGDTDPFYLTPAQQYDREAMRTLSRSGRAMSAAPSATDERTWWLSQDQDQRWIDEQDRTDPKSWK